MYLSHDLTLNDIFTLCRQKYIPEGCVILELGAAEDKELWPVGDNGIVKGSAFEEDSDLPSSEDEKPL